MCLSVCPRPIFQLSRGLLERRARDVLFQGVRASKNIRKSTSSHWIFLLEKDIS